MRGISSWAIRHPVPVLVLFTILAFAGIRGYGTLRINNLPDMEFPTITVSVSQPGASPTELETQVTDIVENAVMTLAGIESVTSSVNEGSSSTSIEFGLDVDVDRAYEDVVRAVAGVQDNLPQGIPQPIVSRVEVGANPILAYAVKADGLDPDQLSWLVDNNIGKDLLAVEGVSKVTRLGGVSRAIVADLGMDRLAAHGLTVQDVNAALAQWNLNQTGGRAVVDGREQSIRTVGRVSSVEDLKSIRIGGGVSLSDVATIQDTWEEPRAKAAVNGRDAVAFEVYPSKTASQVHVAELVREAVAGMEGKYPGVQLTEVNAASDFVVQSYEAAVEALWVGALLAVLVVWAFLRDFRATMVAALAMPLSLVPTFAVMSWLGLSLNNITLLALSLVVGILVDDAIVEIENIVRHMRKDGKSAYSAAIEAADEIGLAVVATTMTIVAVFVPVSFMPGIPGKFFMSFAVVTCVSVLFSLLVARTLTPLLGAFFFRSSSSHAEEGHGRVTDWYIAFLGIAMRFRWTTMLAGAAFLAGSVFLAMQLKTEFMPATDRGQTVMSVSLESGSTLDATDRVVSEIQRRLEGDPSIERIFSTIGSGIDAGGGPRRNNRADVSSARVTVTLKPRSQRSETQQEFERRISDTVRSIPGARIQYSGLGYSGASISVTLAGEDSDLLAVTAEKLAEEMGAVPGLSNAASTAQASKPEIVVTPRNDVSADVGITVSQIASALNMATLGPSDSSLAKFNLGDRQIPILPRIDPADISTPEDIAALPVKASNATVPLGMLAEVGFGSGPSSIRHVDGRRSVTVRADLNGLTLGEAQAKVAGLAVMKNLPDGIRQLEQGDSKRLRELFSGFAFAFATGVLLMYLTLVLLFNSFLQPLTILIALPLSIGGAMSFLWVTGASLAMSVLIGVLLLLGIAAKNSILMVDYAIMARAEGVPRLEALLDAARKRVRPIIMTSIAMCAGMMPIALGIGADSESRAPMALAVIGGLVSSTTLSLVYVPVFYTLVDDLESLLRRLFGRFVNAPE